MLLAKLATAAEWYGLIGETIGNTIPCGIRIRKDINKLESVQRLACKICTKNWSASRRMKLQSEIGHFPSICGTCPNKNRYVLPNCLNDKCAHARTRMRKSQRKAWMRG